jgi:transmembrane sensor
MSSETTNWEAVARYLAGESPAEEQAAVRQWLADHPADAKAFAALDDILARAALKPELARGIDVEAALARVNTRRREIIPLRRRQLDWVPLAAAAGILLAATLWWRTSATREAPVTTIAARTLTTPVGGRDSLVLPDGSQVILGPGSELTIAEGFGQGDRRVGVRGEALFTVVHDQRKPFVVAANGLEIRDVGTAFVVHSDGSGVRVAVTAGVVELAVPSHAVTTLEAGDAASVSPNGEVAAQRGVGADDDLAWTMGRLVFHDAPLSDVAEDLKRWYGVELDIRDAALRRRPLSATFQGDSLASVLTTIAKALGATIERRGDTAVVRSAR